jgi:hypothetical protein
MRRFESFSIGAGWCQALSDCSVNLVGMPLAGSSLLFGIGTNDNTIDREGRLITCEHSGRRVTRTEFDGTITVIADHYNGKKLNSPNDVVVASNGSVWFTDPTYGIKGYYEVRLWGEQGAANRSARSARARLRLVHRRLRYRRSEERKGAARRISVSWHLELETRFQVFGEFRDGH